MIKYIGIIIFCSAVSAYGAYLSHGISHALKIREELLSFIKHIENSIRYTNAPLYSIYASFTSNLLEKCGFTQVLKKESISEKDIDESLYMLSDDEKSLIYEMLQNLGKSHYTEKELSLISGCKAAFEEKSSRRQNDDKVRVLLYKKLGLIAALISAIILI